jgi:hypothetical protein
MKRLTRLTVVLFAAVFAFGAGQRAAAQSGDGMGGHGQGMTREDPIPFTRDIEQAAAGILSQLKAGRAMDAKNSVSRLNAATDKLLPHITDAGLKDRLTAAVNGIKTTAGARSPDLLDLEDTVDALGPLIEEVRKKLRGMN